MKRLIATSLLCLTLAACSNPRNTVIPQDVEQMAAIKPELEKLTPEEQQLAAAYILRVTLVSKMAGAFGGKEGPGIPQGTTLGKAVDLQRAFVAEQKAEEARQAELKAQLEARREAAMKPLREAVTVTLVSKSIETDRRHGITMDELLLVDFGYRNNTSKDIAAVKGYVSVQDLFGDEISGFAISNDSTIPAGQSVIWQGSRSVRFSTSKGDDRKLASLDESKYKVVWTPEAVVFVDGSTLALPDESAS